MRERTLVILKPDVMARGITGEIVSRFEKLGLKIIGMKMLQADPKVAAEHYKKDDEWLLKKGKQISEQLKLAAGSDEEYKANARKVILNPLVTDIQLYPIVAIVLEGHKAVHMVKKHVGPTSPEEALPGTIRGDYSQDSYLLANTLNRPVINMIHCTDDPKEADREINLWFKADEVIDWVKLDETLLFRRGN
ncbi:MAG TPA: nucleoside-diphosphate kinase [Candidatus Nanoarchaeia archaeon]|nr:nucleoside-diphosphate kinase [Candidatus Nanoarchaeia archaeon]